MLDFHVFAEGNTGSHVILSPKCRLLPCWLSLRAAPPLACPDTGWVRVVHVKRGALYTPGLLRFSLLCLPLGFVSLLMFVVWLVSLQDFHRSDHHSLKKVKHILSRTVQQGESFSN